MKTTEALKQERSVDLSQRVSEVLRLLCAQQESHVDLARACGRHPSAITRSLKGERRWQLDDLQAFADYFDVEPALFLADPSEAIGAASVIRYVIGDATQPEAVPAVVVHVCNDVGKWGAGFTRALSRRSPVPEWSYRRWYASREQSDFGLGATQLVEVDRGRLWVVNMVAQHGVGPSDEPRVRYDALENTLSQAAADARRLNASVHMPRIGCGLAGGSWDQVGPIVETTFRRSGVDVFVYDPPD